MRESSTTSVRRWTLHGAFSVAFTGKFTAPATGAFALNGFMNDDTMAYWIDLNQNGTFELAGSSGSELAVQGGCCGLDVTSAALNLTSGQSYNVAFVVEDTGGPGSIAARYNTPGAPTLQLVNPSNPQGIFGTTAGGLLVSTGAEMRALTIDGAADVSVNGTLRLNNTAAATSTVGSLHNNPAAGGTIALEAGNTLIAQRLEVSGATTFIKNGPGTLTANTQVLGDGSTFQVDAGLVNLNGPANGGGGVVVNNSATVSVNGAINGSTTVNTGGTLGGTGQAGPVNSQGTVAPGNGVGNTGHGRFRAQCRPALARAADSREP